MVIVIKTGTPEAAIRQLLAQLAAQNVKGGWPVQASDRVEAVLEAVGLRG